MALLTNTASRKLYNLASIAFTNCGAIVGMFEVYYNRNDYKQIFKLRSLYSFAYIRSCLETNILEDNAIDDLSAFQNNFFSKLKYYFKLMEESTLQCDSSLFEDSTFKFAITCQLLLQSFGEEPIPLDNFPICFRDWLEYRLPHSDKSLNLNNYAIADLIK